MDPYYEEHERYLAHDRSYPYNSRYQHNSTDDFRGSTSNLHAGARSYPASSTKRADEEKMSGTDVALVVLFIVPFLAGYGVYKGGKALIWDLPRKHLRRSKPKQSPYAGGPAPKPEYTRSETYIRAPYDSEERLETVRQRPRDVEGAPAGETLQPEFSRRAKPFSRRPSRGSL